MTVKIITASEHSYIDMQRFEGSDWDDAISKEGAVSALRWVLEECDAIE